MTPELVAQMDVFEHYPVFYDRIVVQLIDKEGELFEGIAYIMNPTDKYMFPDHRYLNACALTDAAHYYLPPKSRSDEIDYTKTTLTVINGTTGVNEGPINIDPIEYDSVTHDVIYL